MSVIGIIGAGAMGSGIAQVAAMSGWEVRLFDTNPTAKVKALESIQQSINKFISKSALSDADGMAIMGRIFPCDQLATLADSNLVIEAIIEDINIKKQVFQQLESVVDDACIIASNTSSLSIASIASALSNPSRCIGIHFFNPPVLMKLVEIIPAVQTDDEVTRKVVKIVESWGKIAVLAKDTPGFIVNKVARPYYGEAIKMLEEGLATIEEIDQSMTDFGFKMGPFTLMDFIGHDVNYKVTESVWRSFYFDGRYKPSFTQLRLMEAGYLGKKTGRGFYNYATTSQPTTVSDQKKDMIFLRIISMLVNEASDTVYLHICSEQDVELAMKLGVNYPKGLLTWGKEIGYQKIVNHLDDLFRTYGEERYRVSPYLRNLAKN